MLLVLCDIYHSVVIAITISNPDFLYSATDSRHRLKVTRLLTELDFLQLISSLSTGIIWEITDIAA